MSALLGFEFVRARDAPGAAGFPHAMLPVWGGLLHPCDKRKKAPAPLPRIGERKLASALS